MILVVYLLNSAYALCSLSHLLPAPLLSMSFEKTGRCAMTAGHCTLGASVGMAASSALGATVVGASLAAPFYIGGLVATGENPFEDGMSRIPGTEQYDARVEKTAREAFDRKNKECKHLR